MKQSDCHDEIHKIIQLAIEAQNLHLGKVSFCKRKRDLKDGDFAVLQSDQKLSISSEIKEKLKEEILQKLSHGPWKAAHLSFPSFCFMSIHLDRPSVYRHVLTSMVSDEAFQTVVKTENRKCVLIYIPGQSSENNTVEDLRMIIVAQHVYKLLTCNGFDVKLILQSMTKSRKILMEKIEMDPDEIQSEKVQADSNFLDLSEKHKLGNNPYIIHKSIVKKHESQSTSDLCDALEPSSSCTYCVVCTCASWTEDKTILAVGDSVDDTCIDFKSYFKNTNIRTGKGNYEKSIELLTPSIAKKDGSCTDLLKEIICLHDSVIRSKGQILLHLTSEKRFYHQQIVDLSLQSLYGANHVQQVHLTCGLVTGRQGSDHSQTVTTEDFIDSRMCQMREAAVMKYGDRVQGSSWDDTIQKLTMASLKFEFLTTSLKNKVKLDLSQGQQFGGGVDNRAGAFVMYNCARLATLFKHFEENVVKGIYPPLPDISCIDFSTLKEENEWELFFNFLFVYNEMIIETTKDCVPEGSITSQIQTHKVSNFLISVSRQLSSYYSRTHILGENRPHLLPTMYARLYFMKVTHKVMCHALNSMGIQPLDQL